MQCELICAEKQNRKTETTAAGEEVNECCAICSESSTHVLITERLSLVHLKNTNDLNKHDLTQFIKLTFNP